MVSGFGFPGIGIGGCPVATEGLAMLIETVFRYKKCMFTLPTVQVCVFMGRKNAQAPSLTCLALRSPIQTWFGLSRSIRGKP